MPQDACTKCEKQLDTTGYPLWCKSCRAENKREYEATKKGMSESRGFCAGITAMRHHIATQFSRYGSSGSFSGSEIAYMVTTCKGPELPQ